MTCQKYVNIFFYYILFTKNSHAFLRKRAWISSTIATLLVVQASNQPSAPQPSTSTAIASNIGNGRIICHRIQPSHQLPSHTIAIDSNDPHKHSIPIVVHIPHKICSARLSNHASQISREEERYASKKGTSFHPAVATSAFCQRDGHSCTNWLMLSQLCHKPTAH